MHSWHNPGANANANHPIKILHIITRLIPGGAQENTLLTVALTDRQKYEVHLATGSKGAWLERGAEAADSLHILPSLINPISPFYDAAALLEMLRLLRRERFSIVHTHTSKAGILGRLAAHLAKTPVVVHTPHGTVLHDAFFTAFEQRMIALLKRWAAKHTEAIITVSECEKHDYISRQVAPVSKFHTIYSGLNLRRFEQLLSNRSGVRASLGLYDHDQMIFFPARYAPEKGHTFFFSAIAQVLQQFPQAQVILAGDGPLKKQVECLSLQTGFSDRIHLLGHRNDVLALMDAADVVVSASLSEGLPRTVVEALLLARPVVATDAGGTREVIHHQKTGLLVPCRDAQALAEAITYLITHPTEANAMGAAGQAYVRPLFDARVMVKQIEGIYQEYLAREAGLVIAS